MKIIFIGISLMIFLIFFPINAKSSELVTINTFLPWKTQDKTLYVSIIKETPLSADQLSNIKKAITGYGTVKFDDTETFVSWNEALQTTSQYTTKISMPTNIVLLSDNSEADITISITDKKNENYSGYTTHVIENDRIIKSNITIYDINSMTGKQISSIVRHEFGHALGLAHADSPDDLMYGVIQVPSYVTECDLDTLLTLYDGNVKNSSNCGV